MQDMGERGKTGARECQHHHRRAVSMCRVSVCVSRMSVCVAYEWEGIGRLADAGVYVSVSVSVYDIDSCT